MSIVYHHHMGTGIQTTEEINRLMKKTDANPYQYALLAKKHIDLLFEVYEGMTNK